MVSAFGDWANCGNGERESGCSGPMRDSHWYWSLYHFLAKDGKMTSDLSTIKIE